MLQRNLTGPGREEREEVVGKVEPLMEKTRSKEKLSQEETEVVEKFFELICGDISRERDRVGGNWAIAGTIHFRHHRDIIKSVQSRQQSTVTNLLIFPSENCLVRSW